MCRSPFSVLRSPFSVHRFPFSVLLVLMGILMPVSLSAQNVPTVVGSAGSDLYGNNNGSDTTKKEPEGIIFDVTEESDSLLASMVNGFEPAFRAVKIYRTQNPLITPHGAELFDHLHGIDGFYYAHRGAQGQCHISLFPYDDETYRLVDFHAVARPLTFNVQSDPFPALRQHLHNYRMFQTRRPYTVLQYGNSLNKDYQIGIVHTQNINPRWNIAMRYDLISRDGLYTNAGGTNHLLDLTTNYYSPDARYQVQASITYNRLRQEENGGVLDDTTWQTNSRRQGVPVNMYSAQNQWRDLVVDIHQSYNTVRQFYSVVQRDSLMLDSTGAADTLVVFDTLYPHNPHVYNTGVFGLDLHAARHRRIFTDADASSWFYNYAAPDTSVYNDSTAHYKVSADLYWTNDAYMQHRWHNPLVLLFGIRPELNSIRDIDTTHTFFTVSPFARGVFDVGRFRLMAQAEEVTGGDRNGDYRLQGVMQLRLGQRSLLDLAVRSEAQTPDFLYQHHAGCYNWDFDGFRKVKRQQIAAGYNLSVPDSVRGHIRLLETRTSAMIITDNIWLNNTMQPTQGNATGLLLQASALAQLRFGWFNIRLQQMLQSSSDDDVVRVPLFATKNSIYADMHIFHRTLHLQTGVDLRYHTRYRADGWNPVLAAWYRQDDVEVGDYLVADLWLTLQVKRASIYLKACHLNALIEDLAGRKPTYFSLPHYPMEDFGLYWGVTWKFFD